jgi:hypothetical protein
MSHGRSPSARPVLLTNLILKRASASRPSGEWNDDDYDVLADGVVVGRIFKGLSPARIYARLRPALDFGLCSLLAPPSDLLQLFFG